MKVGTWQEGGWKKAQTALAKMKVGAMEPGGVGS